MIQKGWLIWSKRRGSCSLMHLSAPRNLLKLERSSCCEAGSCGCGIPSCLVRWSLSSNFANLFFSLLLLLCSPHLSILKTVCHLDTSCTQNIVADWDVPSSQEIFLCLTESRFIFTPGSFCGLRQVIPFLGHMHFCKFYTSFLQKYICVHVCLMKRLSRASKFGAPW